MDTTFEDLRPLLFSVAYRMLGSVADAEDVLQDAYLRWQRVPEGEADSPRAYLTSIVTRLSIDALRSARVRRETYVGPWLPEPIVTDPSAGPEDQVELSDSLSSAFLVLLETLSPVERAVFLLREAFGYDYDEIARTVGKSEQNCRQLLVRAKKHIEARRPRFRPDEKRRDELLTGFMAACMAGDFDALMSVLSEDVVEYGDGGGVVSAGRRSVVGREKVARFLIGLAGKIAGHVEPRRVLINGQPGILFVRDGTPFATMAFDFGPDGIREIDTVVNPEKLANVTVP